MSQFAPDPFEYSFRGLLRSEIRIVKDIDGRVGLFMMIDEPPVVGDLRTDKIVAAALTPAGAGPQSRRKDIRLSHKGEIMQLTEIPSFDAGFKLARISTAHQKTGLTCLRDILADPQPHLPIGAVTVFGRIPATLPEDIALQRNDPVRHGGKMPADLRLAHTAGAAQKKEWQLFEGRLPAAVRADSDFSPYLFFGSIHPAFSADIKHPDVLRKISPASCPGGEVPCRSRS